MHHASFLALCTNWSQSRAVPGAWGCRLHAMAAEISKQLIPPSHRSAFLRHGPTAWLFLQAHLSSHCDSHGLRKEFGSGMSLQRGMPASGQLVLPASIAAYSLLCIWFICCCCCCCCCMAPSFLNEAQEVLRHCTVFMITQRITMRGKGLSNCLARMLDARQE